MKDVVVSLFVNHYLVSYYYSGIHGEIGFHTRKNASLWTKRFLERNPNALVYVYFTGDGYHHDDIIFENFTKRS